MMVEDQLTRAGEAREVTGMPGEDLEVPILETALADAGMAMGGDVEDAELQQGLSWSLGHHPSHGHRYGARCRDSAGAGVTVSSGRRRTAPMTPPPPASAGARTGNRETRRRAPVSDRPVAVLLAGSSLPP